MPFLVVNSIEIPVAVDTLTEEVREVGSTVQAFSGALVRSRIATKRDLEFEIPLTENTLAGQYERWLRGEGETWLFTTLYGSKGTGPSSGYSGSIDAGNGPSGSSCLLVTTGQTNYRYASADTPFTYAVWYSNNATPGAGYSHYVVTSSTKKWVNGVRNDAATTTFISYSAGELLLYGGSNRRFARLMILPYVVDDSWPPLFYGTAGAGEVASGTVLQPYLNLTGDVILETTRSAMGEVMDTSVVAANGTTMRKLTARLSQR